jgi:protein TonB
MIAARGIDSDDLRLWFASAAVVLAVHAGATAMLLRWHEPVEGDEGTATIVVDLAPYLGPESESKQNLAPGPEQQQFTPSEPQPETPEAKIEEKVEPPPPVPEPEVVLPPEPKPLERPREEPRPFVPQTTAPPPPRPSAARVASWHRQIVLQIERHKGYPAAAQARHQIGIAQLAFTINRQGRVVASRVVQSSGHPLLDQETIATVQRAQPFPVPPPNMPGETFDFTVPMRFNIR